MCAACMFDLQCMECMEQYSIDSGGIRTHAFEKTGALNQRLRPLGHAILSYLKNNFEVLSVCLFVCFRPGTFWRKPFNFCLFVSNRKPLYKTVINSGIHTFFIRLKLNYVEN